MIHEAINSFLINSSQRSIYEVKRPKLPRAWQRGADLTRQQTLQRDSLGFGYTQPSTWPLFNGELI